MAGTAATTAIANNAANNITFFNSFLLLLKVP
jgi:hypothetical protein